jgi:ATPase family AAA domain-containing protein 1
MLDQGFQGIGEDITDGSLQRLRPVTMEDFDKALSKLKRSVSEKGKELAKVWEWNDEYGEIKRKNRNLPHLANMYL